MELLHGIHWCSCISHLTSPEFSRDHNDQAALALQLPELRSGTRNQQRIVELRHCLGLVEATSGISEAPKSEISWNRSKDGSTGLVELKEGLI